ncbi:hypothetical protein EXIGLDRAFT_301327 [Exidia glandulosa HHB12029]|uniref:Uncharacterized protein n=1 Tax=Exidia glandulosa HHB12029 TaxID=1314781 RepID=A0A165D7P6_EXIGL|nr:hypothetical protein EXIGLDRAFT_301327 [Exidia glandulosa HHB12029]
MSIPRCGRDNGYKPIARLTITASFRLFVHCSNSAERPSFLRAGQLPTIVTSAVRDNSTRVHKRRSRTSRARTRTAVPPRLPCSSPPLFSSSLVFLPSYHGRPRCSRRIQSLAGERTLRLPRAPGGRRQAHRLLLHMYHQLNPRTVMNDRLSTSCPL